MGYTYQITYEDSQQNAISLRDVGSNVPTLTQIGTSGIYKPKFIIDDLLIFTVQLTHKYQQGGSVYPHVHWVGEDNEANAVRWQLTYQWVNINGLYNPTTSTVDPADGLCNDAYKHILTPFSTIVGTGKTISSIISGNIKRITNGGSEYTGDVFLDYLDFHIPQDADGSRQVAAK